MPHPEPSSRQSTSGLDEQLGRLRSLSEHSQKQHAFRNALPGEIAAAIDDVRRAASAEADAIVARARKEARQVLDAARVELTVLVAQIVELRRQREEALVNSRQAPSPQGAASRPGLLASGVVVQGAGAKARPVPAAPPAAPTTRARRRLHDRAVFASVALVVCSVVTMLWVAMGRPQGGPARSAESAAARTAVGEASATAVPSDRSGASSSTYTVTAQAIRDVWIRPEVDGTRSDGYLMKAGSSRRWTVSRLTMRVGDAGALLVGINGGAPTALGRDGQVVTRTFGHAVAQADGAGRRRRPGETSSNGELSGPLAPGAPPATSAPAAKTALTQPIALEPPSPTAPASANGTGVPQSSERPRGPDDPPAPLAPSNGSPAPATTTPQHSGSPAQTSSTRDVLLARDREWFAAQYSGNRAAMMSLVAPAFELLDERAETERPGRTDGAVTRALRDVEIHVAGEGAVLSATMVEGAPGRGGREYTSRLSEVWILQDGDWRLLGVRIAPVGIRSP